MTDHLELYNTIDIGLDPFPFNGATTTCEALWMGVPVITLLGDRHVGRVGASILTNVGLKDFIAQDIDDYIKLAIKMAANTDYLQEIRQGLRERMQKSPLCDGTLFAKDVEKAYQYMWRKNTNDIELNNIDNTTINI
jgi:protein O-GlcNAc transferase